jgi:hypothetical protein
MRFLLLPTLLSCLQVMPSFARQPAAGPDTSFQGAIIEATRSVGYTWGELKEGLFSRCSPVRLIREDIPLAQKLKYYCKNQPVTFVIKNKVVVFMAKDLVVNIYDEKDHPLARVTIESKSDTAMTDDAGNCVLKQAACDDMIVITCIGRQSQTISIENRTTITVKLSAKATEMSYVVVLLNG